MKKAFIGIAALLTLLALGGCGKEQPTAEVTRLDRVVARFGEMNEDERLAAVDSLALPLSDYLFMMGLTSGDLAGSIDTLSQSAAYAVFFPDTEARLGDLKPTERALRQLDDKLISSGALSSDHRYYGVISPFNQSVMTVDTMVFVALNHYLGPDYAGYEGMPEYMRSLKYQGRIPYDVAESVLVAEYPYERGAEATVLNRLLYEGALADAVISSVEGATLQSYLGWSDEQMKMVDAREKDLWQALVAREMLYSTDETLAERLVAPSPATTAIAPDVPGRAGRYVGYKIVQAYKRANPEATIKDLLSPSLYNDQRALIKASYNPLKRARHNGPSGSLLLAPSPSWMEIGIDWSRYESSYKARTLSTHWLLGK